jgi:hypothetical protein
MVTYIEKFCELLETCKMAISSQASKEEGSTTIRKEYTQVSGSAEHPKIG